MAEFLTEKQERLLPEYELMKKLQICTDEQIKDLMQKRNNFQVKISQRGKSVRHFLDFIIFEKKVHKWVCEKEQVLHKNLYGLKAKIASRIISLYRDVVRIFPAEERLWHNYIQFCRHSFPNDVSKIYEKMLSFHADKPHIWCDAGFWIYQYNRNMAKVQDLFFRGLKKHPTSEAIYTAFFGILLLNTSKMSVKRNLQDNTLSEQDVGMEAAEILYRNSKSHIKNITYYLGLLDLCEIRKYLMMTTNLQKLILDDLMDMFPRDERLWHALAKRELRGYNIDNLIQLKHDMFQNDNDSEVSDEVKTEIEQDQIDDKKAVSVEELEELQLHMKTEIKETDIEMSDTEEAAEEEVMETEDNIKKDLKPKRRTYNTVFMFNRLPLGKRIELACKVYKEAVNTLQTTNMWSIYINTMLHLNKNMKTEPVVKRKCLAQAFNEGHKSGLMSVEHYETYVRLLLETEAGPLNAAKIIKEAVNHSSNAEIYKLLLSIHIKSNDDDKINEIFAEAKRKLGMVDALPVIKTVLDYYQLDMVKNRQKLENLYDELCAQIKPEFSIFRGEYLEYIFDMEGIKKARTKYAELSKIPPPCIYLHKMMHDLEVQANELHEKDENHWRSVHENCTYYFGKSDPDTWIDYINFECEHGDPKRISNLHKRAVATLKPDLVDNFIMKFGLMKVMSV